MTIARASASRSGAAHAVALLGAVAARLRFDPRMRIPELAAAALSLLLPLLTVPHGTLVLGGDSPAPELDPGLALSNGLSSWADHAGFGKNNALYAPFLFPVVFADVALAAIGLPAIAINHAWLVAILLAQSLGVIVLARTLFPALRSQTALTFVGFASVLNPWVMFAFHAPYPALNLAVALSPALIAALLRFMRDPALPRLAVFATLCILNIAANTNPAYVAVQLALFALVIATSAAARPTRRTAIAAGVAAVSYAGVNATFWLPLLDYARNAPANLAGSVEQYSRETLRVTSEFSALPQSARLVGGYLFFNSAGLHKFIRDGNVYVSNGLVVAATLALPVLALAALWLCRRGPERVTVFALGGVTLVALFVAKGIAPPFGDLFGFLFDRLPILHLFRDSFGKVGWVVVDAYSLLAGAAVARLLELAPRRPWPARAGAAVAFAGIAVGAFPMFSGELYWRDLYVNPPARYAAVAAHLRDALGTHGRFIETPVAPGTFSTYDWGYAGASLYQNVLATPDLSRSFDIGDSGAGKLDDDVQLADAQIGTTRVAPLLGLLGVQAAVADASVDRNYFAHQYSFLMRSAPPRMRATFTDGPLAVYGVDPGLRNSRVYAASQLVTGAESDQQMADVCVKLPTCAGVAFLHAASDMPDLPVLRARFGDASDLGDAAAATPPLLRVDAGRVAAPRAPGAIAVVDAAMRAIGGGSKATAFREPGYARGTPVALAVAAHASGPGGFVPYSAGDVEALPGAGAYGLKPVTCSKRDDVEASESGLELPAAAVGKPALLTFAYDLPGRAYGWFGLIDDSTPRLGSTLMPLDPGRGTIARMFVPPSRNLRIVAGVQNRGNAASCLAISRLAIARPVHPERYDVPRADADLSLSSVYAAVNRTALLDFANERYTRTVRDVRRRGPALAAAALSDLSPAWSPPDVVVGSGTNAQRFGADGGTTLEAENELADVHATFGHLRPGQSYAIDVPVRAWTSAPPRIALVAATGQILYNAFVSADVPSTTVTVRFVDPPDTDEVGLYVYTGVPGAARSSAAVGAASIALDRYGAEALALARPYAALPIPKIDLRQISTHEWRLHVSGAPERYMLAFESAYDRGWTLAGPAGAVGDHFRTNIFMNGWSMHQSGDYDLTLYYAPDLWRGLGLGTGLELLLAAFAATFFLLRTPAAPDAPTPAPTGAQRTR